MLVKVRDTAKIVVNGGACVTFRVRTRVISVLMGKDSITEWSGLNEIYVKGLEYPLRSAW